MKKKISGEKKPKITNACTCASGCVVFLILCCSCNFPYVCHVAENDVALVFMTLYFCLSLDLKVTSLAMSLWTFMSGLYLS